MKTNIKMRVTPEQSKKVQEICFENGIEWINVGRRYIGNIIILYIGKDLMFSGVEFPEAFKEIDADLFIRTNGTCEENQAKRLLEKLENMEDVEIYTAKEFNNISLKLKKKNEILKKARIKRKNQREELHKLNVKLQKCISFEAHNIATQKLRDTIVTLRDDVINKVDNMRDTKNKEIEKLKAVIEYLESKVK